MKGLAPLFLGIFGTFAFSWVGLTVLPNWQIGHLNPQSDEDGTDIYPRPQSGMFERGAHVYAANGCVYCHSQQVRAEYAGADIERGWGNRRSAPRDYIFERPVFLAKMRMGQDIANIGARAPAEQQSPPPAGAASPAASPAQQGGSPLLPGASPGAAASPATQGAAVSSGAVASAKAASPPPQAPGSSPAKAASPAPPTGIASPSPGAMANSSPGATTTPSSGLQTAGAPWPEQTLGEPPMYSAAWHHVHLYSPRSINFDSNMPAYRFLYEKRRIRDQRSAEALKLTGSDAPPEGWEVIPTYDAKCLVAYLMALNQSHPLNDVRSAGGAPAASTAPSPAAAAGSPPPSPPPAK
ncbi:MAG TPA: cbb3-type cytochrome c oxidase subunit II [Candidatus Acidoferrum sp.]|jgi:cbb3-type cytochrome oxidase cytochrome c subunit|nr:cbb3-type cytochrome c oxidase subunit II [Candidatus Acidoferrum sp.]